MAGTTRPSRKAKEKCKKSLSTRYKSSKNLPKEPEENPECAICLDKVIIRGKLGVCDHWFCFSCIREWSENTNTCPLCKARFRSITKIGLAVNSTPSKVFRVNDKDQVVNYSSDEDRASFISILEDIFTDTSASDYDADEPNVDRLWIHSGYEHDLHNEDPSMPHIINFSIVRYPQYNEDEDTDDDDDDDVDDDHDQSYFDGFHFDDDNDDDADDSDTSSSDDDAPASEPNIISNRLALSLRSATSSIQSQSTSGRVVQRVTRRFTATQRQRSSEVPRQTRSRKNAEDQPVPNQDGWINMSDKSSSTNRSTQQENRYRTRGGTSSRYQSKPYENEILVNKRYQVNSTITDDEEEEINPFEKDYINVSNSVNRNRTSQYNSTNTSDKENLQHSPFSKKRLRKHRTRTIAISSSDDSSDDEVIAPLRRKRQKNIIN